MYLIVYRGSECFINFYKIPQKNIEKSYLYVFEDVNVLRFSLLQRIIMLRRKLTVDDRNREIGMLESGVNQIQIAGKLKGTKCCFSLVYVHRQSVPRNS